jgi:hypothetical protein
LIPKGWFAVPFSKTEYSEHLAYKIENGVLTFHDFGNKDDADFGILPNYTNSSDVESKYNITQWYIERYEIKKVIFDETISYIGEYVLTNLDNITHIYVENPKASTTKNAVLISTTEREEALEIYCASTFDTEDYWLRGSGNRKISTVISSVTMYFTDHQEDISNLTSIENELLKGEKITKELFLQAVELIEKMSLPQYSISDYKYAICNAEDLLDLVFDLVSGECGNGATYLLETKVLHPLSNFNIIVPVNLKSILKTFLKFTISELDILTKFKSIKLSSHSKILFLI